MKTISYLTIFISICAYGLFTYAIIKEYITTLPFCQNGKENEKCIPCPNNAKCVQAEIQCDERYVYQGGQCLPIHLVETSQKDELNSIFHKENSIEKRYFLLCIEFIISIAFIIFVIVQIRQGTSFKTL